jgi:hypothetical protein
MNSVELSVLCWKRLMDVLPLEVAKDVAQKCGGVDVWGRPMSRTVYLCEYDGPRLFKGIDFDTIEVFRTYREVGSPTQLADLILQDRKLWRRCGMPYSLYFCRFQDEDYLDTFTEDEGWLNESQLARLRQAYEADPSLLLADLTCPEMHQRHDAISFFFQDEHAWNKLLSNVV